MLTARDIYINLYNFGSPKQLSFVHGSNGSILISDPHHDLCKHFWLAGSKVLKYGEYKHPWMPNFCFRLEKQYKIWHNLRRLEETDTPINLSA